MALNSSRLQGQSTESNLGKGRFCCNHEACFREGFSIRPLIVPAVAQRPQDRPVKAIDQEQSLATVHHVLQVFRRLDRLGVVVPHRNLPERRLDMNTLSRKVRGCAALLHMAARR
jgi:hypothetical protein